MYKENSSLGKRENFRVSILLSNVFANLGTGRTEQAVQSLVELRKHLAGGFFDNSQQQDAQEFLQSLVNQVKEELDEVQGTKPFV